MKKNGFVTFILIMTIMYSVKAQTTQPIFDGKTLTGWKILAGSGTYTVEDGTIVGTTVFGSPNTFLATEKEYDNFIFEADVKIEDTISNSGIQFRSHFDANANNGNGLVYGYQCEEDGSSRNWSGGIYEEGRRGWLYPVALNPNAKNAFHVNEYNHYKIEAIGNHLKTWVNGVPVSYVIDTVSAKGFIALQVHSVGKAEESGKKMYWKNLQLQTENLQSEPFPREIFIVNKALNYLSSAEKQHGWKLLFDGQSGNGWKGAYKKNFPDSGWKIENGILTVMSSEGKESANGGDIVTKEKYRAFDFQFHFKLTPGANSGVKYFVTLKENNPGSAIGLEYQLLDDEIHPDAKLGRDGNRTLASLYDLIKAEKAERYFHKPGQWNWGRIVVHPDSRVEHWLNGIKVLEYFRSSEEFRHLVELSKYKVWDRFGEAPEGHILFQDHGNEVSFHSIKIKELE